MEDNDVVQILLQIKNEKKQTTSQEYETYNARKDFDDRTLGIFTTWLNNHKNNPYPTVDEKKQLCNATGCSIRQVNDWFANARRRKLKHSGFKKTRAKKNQTTATKFVRPVLNYHIYFFAAHAKRAMLKIML